MNVLLTGAFGIVGTGVLDELILRNHNIRIFDIKTAKNKQTAKKYKNIAEIIWGDLRNPEDVEKAVSGVDVIIHTGAMIPPAADRMPELAETINVGGTANIINAMKKQKPAPKLVYTSSIAIYGDRRKNPHIKTTDPLIPTSHDYYAKQKLQCEELIKESELNWVILRLTYIVSMNKLQLDPLMFEMPLDTCIEICHTRDVGLALANAVEHPGIWGKVMNLAGGENCRTTYKEYLDRMLHIFGIGKRVLPDSAFSKEDFHCGFMDTRESQQCLKYQRCTLEDYYKEVEKKISVRRYLFIILRPFIRMFLLSKSPHYRKSD